MHGQSIEARIDIPLALVLFASISGMVGTGATIAADLPLHRQLRVLIVSDEVNPHSLPPGDLTQPGEISTALRLAGSGLDLDPAPDGVHEIPTDAIEQATALLSLSAADPGAYDVLIYFAHRIPASGPDPLGRQQAFTVAVEDFLERGGGVISFHHGAYTAAGKAGILDLIGATATGAVPWNIIDGQNVINVSDGHFVTCNGLAYTGTVAYSDPGRGVPADTYSYFNNTPDERYPFFEYNVSAAGNVQTIFGSDYNENGTSHLLGFTHQRPAWSGIVVAYQPGEYQPNALDDLNGNNFQILANAIVYAAGALPPDEITAGAAPGALVGDIDLDWSGCAAGFSVYRSDDPANVTDPANLLGATSGTTWTDTPPAGPVHYYRVVAP